MSWKNLWKTTAVVSSLTFLSRILGFIRDMLAAFLFGASGSYDAFLVAFKIPNFMRRVFGEGAFSQAFVPVLAEVHGKQSPEEESRFIQHVGGCLLSVLMCVLLLGVIGAPWVVYAFAPGFETDGRFEIAVSLLRWTFPYIVFISMVAFYSGILNVHNRFAIAAFTPTLLNVAMIGAMLITTDYFALPVQSLVVGVLIGGVLQLTFLFPSLYRINRLTPPIPNWHDKSVRRVLRLMGPAILGASVVQINMLIGSIFASFLPTGSITWLYYAERMMEFPMGILGASVTTVTLPYLAKQHAQGDKHAFQAALDWGLQSLLMIGIPASLGLYVLSGPILTTLFQYGAFSAADVLNTQLALNAFSLALLAYLATKLFVSAYYAMQDTKFPVKVACVCLLVNVISNFILMGPLKHQGLALSATISALTNAALLLGVLIHRKHYRLPDFFLPFFLRVLSATLLMVVALCMVTPAVDRWFAWSASYRLFRLSMLIGMGAGVYGGTLYLLGIRRWIRQT